MFIRNRKYTNLQNSVPKHNLAVSIQCTVNMFIIIKNKDENQYKDENLEQMTKQTPFFWLWMKSTLKSVIGVMRYYWNVFPNDTVSTSGCFSKTEILQLILTPCMTLTSCMTLVLEVHAGYSQYGWQGAAICVPAVTGPDTYNVSVT